MKKLFLSFFLAASFYSVNAQVEFGAKAGVNLANLTGDDVEDSKARIGFNVGVFAEIPISEAFVISPEVVYSLQGAKQSFEEEGFKISSSYNLSYINVPVLARYKTESGFFAETGPQIGFLASAKGKATVEYEGESESETTDIKDQLKSTDFSWAFGVGYSFSENMGLNLRYNLGLSKVGDADASNTKNSVFQLGVFYKFGSN